MNGESSWRHVNNKTILFSHLHSILSMDISFKKMDISSQLIE
jgi:hypothetical protein